MRNVLSAVKGIDRSDKYMFAGMLATVVVWWLVIGRTKYSTRGKRNYG